MDTCLLKSAYATFIRQHFRDFTSVHKELAKQTHTA
jgi:hypothetical protein